MLSSVMTSYSSSVANEDIGTVLRVRCNAIYVDRPITYCSSKVCYVYIIGRAGQKQKSDICCALYHVSI